MANPNKFTAKEVLNKVLLDSSGNAVTANSVTSQEALNSVLDTTNNRLNMSLAGGTISGDVTISGDLTVNGSATNSYDEIVNGQLVAFKDDSSTVGTDDNIVIENDGTGDASLKFSLTGATDWFAYVDNSDSDKFKIRRSTSDYLEIDESGNVAFSEISISGSTISDSSALTMSSGDDIIIDATSDINLDADGGDIRFKDNGTNFVTFSSSTGSTFSGDILVNNSTPALTLQDSDGSNQTLEILHSGANTFFTSRNGSSNGAFFFRSYNGSSFSTALELDSSQNATFNGSIKILDTSAPSIRLNPDASDATDNDRAFIGYATGNDNFITGTVDNDLAIRSSATGNIVFGRGTTESARLDASGNLGIGVTPTKKLELGGGTSGETLLFSNTGVNTTNGARVQANIRYKTGSYAGQNTIQIVTETQFDDSSAVVFNTGGSSTERLRITSGGLIGIGNSNPDKTLVVQASGAEVVIADTGTIPTLRFREGGATKGVIRTSSGSMQLYSGGTNLALTLDSSQNVAMGDGKPFSWGTAGTLNSAIVGNSSTNVLVFYTSGAEKARFDSSGRLGLGVSPSYPLHVENASDTVAYFKSTDNNGQIAVVDDDTTAYFGANGSRAFMGTASGLAGTTNLVVDSNGNVGVGVTSIEQKFEVHGGGIRINGNISAPSSGVSGTLIDYYQSEARFWSRGSDASTVGGFKFIGLENDGGNQSTLFKLNSNSRISLSNNDDGSNNTVFGHKAGNAIASGTEGNVIIGHNAGLVLNGGDSNVAVGADALKSNTTARYNTSVGASALEFNTNGEHNVAIGLSAGRFDVSGSNVTSPDQCIAIGSGSGFSTATPGNQIAIGHNVKGLKDNSITLGNANITDVYMASDSEAIVHCGGVRFPDTQVTSSDVNQLDDYEEGTWTPILSDGTNNFTMVSNQNGRYTKIGRVVHFEAECGTSSIGSASGNLKLIGLPFSSGSSTSEGSCSIGFLRAFNYSADTIQLMAQVNGGTTEIAFTASKDDTTEESVQCSQADSSSFFIRISGTYFV